MHSLPTPSGSSASRRLDWRLWSANDSSRLRARQMAEALKRRGLPGDKDRVADARVVDFGLGAVGGVTFQALSRAGVGTLVGVDPDDLGPESYLTQPSLAYQAGQVKAWVQGAAAHNANPAVVVRTAQGYAQHVPLGELRQADVLVVTTDSAEATVWAGAMATALSKPLVQGAVHPETATAIVRGYDLRDAASSCPACSMGNQEWQNLKSVEGCDPYKARRMGGQPTRTVPTICATAGQLTAHEALKWLCGLEEVALRGEEFSHSLLAHRTWRTTLPRSETCRLPHRAWELIDTGEARGATTLRMLARQMGYNERPGLLQVRSEIPWASVAACDQCGRWIRIQRFARMEARLDRCNCGGWLPAVPAGIREVVPADDLADVWETPLEQLGLEDGAAVGMSEEDDWTYFFFDNEPAQGETP